ncbi:MAG: glutamyl-tRNA reductase [Pseudomonadales bacterium]|nr:glutamyl-tRNA reductase [Pseudomonadales bacterium]
MALIALGINHDTATVEVREKVAFAPEQMSDALQSLCLSANLSEAVILSTCNRTEILAVADNDQSNEILHWLAQYHAVPKVSLQSSSYCHINAEAIFHMMKVACGLDSLILGEPQILGQLKSAFAVAQQAGTVGGALDHAMQHTFSYAKKVRTQTAIGENPVSVAFAAVSLSQRIFSDLSKTSALLIGAGETIDLVAKHLQGRNIGRIIVANRTLTRAEELAKQYSAEAILLSDIPDKLSQVDIVISSTASQLPILGKGAVERALKIRKRRPMFMVDIAVPRDIEPEVADLSDVYLYTVDDLRDIIDENKQARKDEVVKADVILRDGVEIYQAVQRVNSVVPVVKAFRQQAEALQADVLEKGLKQLSNGVDAEKVLESMARLLTNKLIHEPSMQIKKAGEVGDYNFVRKFTELYQLDVDLSEIVEMES